MDTAAQVLGSSTFTSKKGKVDLNLKEKQKVDTYDGSNILLLLVALLKRYRLTQKNFNRMYCLESVFIIIG